MSAVSAFVTSARHVSFSWPLGQAVLVVNVRSTPFEALAQPYTVLWPRGDAVVQLLASWPGLHFPAAVWTRTSLFAVEVQE
jgi:hypothetical protein